MSIHRLAGAVLLAVGFAPGSALAVPLVSATLTLRSDGLGVPPLVFTAAGAAGTATTPAFATLGEFVPEPGTALLFGWGIACLAVAARRKARAG